MINKIKNFLNKNIVSNKDKLDSTLPDGKMKVHLGCGDVNISGFINVDARDMKHIHIVKDDLYLNEFTNNTIEMIYMCHVLEHVSHKKVKMYLEHYYSKLKVKGVLRLSVPDFDKIIHIYNASGEDCDSIKSPLMGGQGYSYNYHYNVFNKKSLISLLQQSGFEIVRVWEPTDEDEFNGIDWSSKKIPYDFGEFEISLNIEAIK